MGGVYGLIRHPSYLGLLVNTLGWGLTFRSAVGVLLAALLVLPILARIRSEENLLRAQFGDPYDAYRARTSRLISDFITRVEKRTGLEAMAATSLQAVIALASAGPVRPAPRAYSAAWTIRSGSSSIAS